VIIQTSYLRTGNLTSRFLTVCLIALISSSLLSVSCTPAHYSSLRETGSGRVNLEKYVPVDSDDKKVLFRTGIDVYGQHFSGMMFIKYFGERHYRTVFITEVGMSIFDFEFNRGNFTDHGSYDLIKKPYILETLKKDLMLILMEDGSSPEAVIYEDSESKSIVYRMNSGDEYNYYYIDRTGSLLKIENSSGNFKKIKIEYSYNADNSVRRIEIRHYNADLMMEFNTLENSSGNE